MNFIYSIEGFDIYLSKGKFYIKLDTPDGLIPLSPQLETLEDVEVFIYNMNMLKSEKNKSCHLIKNILKL